MAIDTNSEKLSLISYGEPWAAPAPLLDGTFSQAELQALLGGYAGVLWNEGAPPGAGSGIGGMQRAGFLRMGRRRRSR